MVWMMAEMLLLGLLDAVHAPRSCAPHGLLAAVGGLTGGRSQFVGRPGMLGVGRGLSGDLLQRSAGLLKGRRLLVGAIGQVAGRAIELVTGLTGRQGRRAEDVEWP